jgi:hypothetical protein
MSYEGTGPLPNCTLDQNNSIGVLLSLAPEQRRDGLRKAIYTLLGDGSHTDGAVMAACQQALVEGSGVPVPKALFAGAVQADAAPVRRVPRHA